MITYKFQNVMTKNNNLLCLSTKPLNDLKILYYKI